MSSVTKWQSRSFVLTLFIFKTPIYVGPDPLPYLKKFFLPRNFGTDIFRHVKIRRETPIFWSFPGYLVKQVFSDQTDMTKQMCVCSGPGVSSRASQGGTKQRLRIADVPSHRSGKISWVSGSQSLRNPPPVISRFVSLRVIDFSGRSTSVTFFAGMYTNK